MPTVSWKDIGLKDVAGPTPYRDRMLDLTDANITRWREDPDGRFALPDALEVGENVPLEKFFPSL